MIRRLSIWSKGSQKEHFTKAQLATTKLMNEQRDSEVHHSMKGHVVRAEKPTARLESSYSQVLNRFSVNDIYQTL
jgi:hypothetical protein